MTSRRRLLQLISLIYGEGFYIFEPDALIGHGEYHLNIFEDVSQLDPRDRPSEQALLEHVWFADS